MNSVTYKSVDSSLSRFSVKSLYCCSCEKKLKNCKKNVLSKSIKKQAKEIVFYQLAIVGAECYFEIIILCQKISKKKIFLMLIFLKGLNKKFYLVD